MNASNPMRAPGPRIHRSVARWVAWARGALQDTASRPRRGPGDLVWVLAVTACTYGLAVCFEWHEQLGRWLARYEHWQLDELPLALAVLACGLAWYAFRRRREAWLEVRRREQAERHVSALLTHNRELAQRLISLQESERRMLARELHDEFGQRCSAIRAETAWLRRCAVGDRDGMLAAARRADNAAHDLNQLVRDLLRRLRPADLDALGLVAALQAQCEAWEERSGVSCTFHHEGVPSSLGESVDIAIYRTVQEGLTNVMRHARASQVRIRLVRPSPDALQLIIHDDGRGMDVTAATRGLGLLGARERAAAVGGRLDVTSRLGQGVRLALHVPLAATEPCTVDQREAA
ncbi:ATP-binding protein [Ideonella sp. DXS29W]|uniref:ATP-binding protein n=1 Tax=Ideonella lacteola TaxID=2984193 RepID=A0ABU9BJU8_9BURK